MGCLTNFFIGILVIFILAALFGDDDEIREDYQYVTEDVATFKSPQEPEPVEYVTDDEVIEYIIPEDEQELPSRAKRHQASKEAEVLEEVVEEEPKQESGCFFIITIIIAIMASVGLKFGIDDASDDQPSSDATVPVTEQQRLPTDGCDSDSDSSDSEFVDVSRDLKYYLDEDKENGM